MKGKKYPHYKILTLFHAKRKDLGRTPYFKELDINKYYFEIYGGYNKFLETIGEKATKIQIKPKYSKEKLINIVKNKSEELGRTPTLKELGLYDYIFKRYGGYSAFLKEIGLKPNKNIYTEAELIKLIKNKAKESGRLPMLKELGIPASQFNRYNGYNSFCHRFINNKQIDVLNIRRNIVWKKYH